MQVHALGHVTVLTADLVKCEAFYAGLLGLRNGPRPPLSVPGFWFYAGDQPVLHVLARAADQAARPAAGLIDHFALEAGGLAAFELRLREAGCAFERRQQAGSGTWQIFLHDPDGVRVELNFAAEEQAPVETLADRLARFDPGAHGKDPMNPAPVGREQ